MTSRVLWTKKRAGEEKKEEEYTLTKKRTECVLRKRERRKDIYLGRVLRVADIHTWRTTGSYCFFKFRQRRTVREEEIIGYRKGKKVRSQSDFVRVEGSRGLDFLFFSLKEEEERTQNGDETARRVLLF